MSGSPGKAVTQSAPMPGRPGGEGHRGEEGREQKVVHGHEMGDLPDGY